MPSEGILNDALPLGSFPPRYFLEIGMLMKRTYKIALGVAFAALAFNTAASAASLNLTATIRDFIANGQPGGHPDFENNLGNDTGFVGTTLGADGKPVYVGGAGTATTHGAAAFNQWYNNAPAASVILTANEAVPGSGIYTYVNNSYFPLGPGNFGFTTEIKTMFTYQGGEIFRSPAMTTCLSSSTTSSSSTSAACIRLNRRV